MTLNKWEAQASTHGAGESGRAAAANAFEGYRRQARIDATAGYAEAISVGVWAGRKIAGVQVNENSNMYKGGQELGGIVGASAALAGGLAGMSALADDAIGFISRAVKRAKCFVAGTPVHTKEGLKPIEQIESGDEVLSWNERTKQVEYKSVVRTFVKQAPVLLAVTVEGEAAPIVTTTDHPFYVRRARDGLPDDEGAWIPAELLQVGDAVRRPTSEWVRVLEVVSKDESATVYNFEVADTHTYFVGTVGVLVHNNDDCVDALKKARGGRGRFQTGEDDLDQLESIQKTQDAIRQGKAEGLQADNIDKSKMRVDNRNKGIRNLQDALDEYDNEP